MNFCLSDQVLSGAIAGAVSVALAYIGLQRLIANLRAKRRSTDADDSHH